MKTNRPSGKDPKAPRTVADPVEAARAHQAHAEVSVKPHEGMVIRASAGSGKNRPERKMCRCSRPSSATGGPWGSRDATESLHVRETAPFHFEGQEQPGEKLHEVSGSEEAAPVFPVEKEEVRERTLSELRTEVGQHPFVQDMKPEHVEALLHCAADVVFDPGDVIFRQGDVAARFYLILEGEVALESAAERGAGQKIQTLKAGDVLGWSWLYPPFLWHFQARAVKPTRAVVCDGACLLVACEENHELGFELLRRVSREVVQCLQATRSKLLECQSQPGANPEAQPAD
jgi:CRP/FNR family transcriptional regulator, cyclic AMP receptor protein